MLFNSYAFLIFLPVVWVIYFFLNHLKMFQTAQGALIVASFVFYGYEDYRLCILLGVSIFANYLLHLSLMKKSFPSGLRKFWLMTGILVNLGMLYYFKYFNFTLENINRLTKADFVLKNIALPLGISFYTFQQVSFVIDSYYGKTEKQRFLDYSLFVSFFPQLVAGPIVLYKEMIPQFKDLKKRKINYENMIAGGEYFFIGFAKKVLVADSFARICDAGYENMLQLNSVSAILTILAFTMEIYFDFSGYCDMALGLGRFFNLMIPVNFDSPYKAITISDFWKRWHMTLTRFLTTYLYIQLGGNRKGMLRTCANVMIVFTVSGLWHGAAWTFVLWGMLHGIAMVLYRLGKKMIDCVPKCILWLCTFLFVNIAWLFFRAEYFRQPLRMLKQVLVGGVGTIHTDMVSALCEHTIWKVTLDRFVSAPLLQIVSQSAVILWFGLWIAVCVKLPSSHELVSKRIRKTSWFVGLSIIFAWSVMWLSQVSKFIYFNF